MVEYHHGRYQGDQLLAGRHAGTVHVADHQHRCGIHHTEGLCRGNDHFPVLASHPEAVHQRADGIGIVVQNHICFLSQGRNQTVDTHRRTEGIRIRPLVGHDENLLLILQQFLEGLCLDAGFHPGGLLGTGALAAEIGHIVSVLHGYLITAASERQTNGHLCIFKGIQETLLGGTDADGQGHGDLISHIQILYIIQQGETVILQGLHVFLAEDEKILVILQMLYDGVDVGQVHVDLPVNQRIQDRMLYLLQGIHDLIIIVDIDQAGDHLLIIGLLLQPSLICHIKQVKHDHNVVTAPFLTIGFFKSK